MPDITFILPHWIYWGMVLLVPLSLMLSVRRSRSGSRAKVSLPLAYFFWAIGGFIGIHRLYLRSWAAAAFIALFVGVLFANHETREARNAHSIAKNESFNAAYDLNAADDAGAEEAEIEALREDAAQKTAAEEELVLRMEKWKSTVSSLALVILAMLLVDGLMIPRVVRSLSQSASPPRREEPPPPDASPPEPVGGVFSRVVGAVNGFVGEFAAYWTVIAVFVFYYEVVARYVFNSPTVWAHESMFLLFGMQYMLAGGYCLREHAHVRVDVLYMHLSARGRATADLVTSVFFVVFTVALIVTGWIFFSDSFEVRQVSHTEWEILYWPIKLSLPIGGALLLLQGIVHLIRDVEVLRGTRSAKEGYGH